MLYPAVRPSSVSPGQPTMPRAFDVTFARIANETDEIPQCRNDVISIFLLMWKRLRCSATILEALGSPRILPRRWIVLTDKNECSRIRRIIRDSVSRSRSRLWSSANCCIVTGTFFASYALLLPGCYLVRGRALVQAFSAGNRW